MVLKLSSQEDPQRTKIKFQKIKCRTKSGSKSVTKNHFWFNKELFGLVFRTFSRGLKNEFYIEPSEMVQGNLKSQKGSLSNQNVHRLP